MQMTLREIVAVALLTSGLGAANSALAQKQGGSEDLPPRQPGEHVDPRGSDIVDLDADDGGVQQPAPL